MNVKKLSLLIIALLLIVCVFSACGGGEEPPAIETGSGEGGGGNPDTCQHNYEEWEVIYEPKCDIRGEEHSKCTLCGEIGIRYINAIGHTEEIIPAVAPTCKTFGKTEGKKCSVCDALLKSQQQLPKSDDHDFSKVASVSQKPTLTQAGRATFECVNCGKTNSQALPQLISRKLTKDDIYTVEASSIYNPAVDNVWKVFDGNTDSAGIYAQGSDWFGDLGDVLVVTLGQEIILKELYVYVAGNWTTATVRVKNANGQTLISESVRANASAYGGPGDKIEVFKGEKYRVYTIEVEITSIKESYQTFKLTEIEIHGAKEDTRLLSVDDKHICDYRYDGEFIVVPTCKQTGKLKKYCYCGNDATFSRSITCKNDDNLISYKAPTCTEKGQAIFKCTCGARQLTRTYPATGHNYQRFVSYTKAPSISSSGMASYKCVTCDLVEEREVKALALEEIKYLRVTQVNGTQVKLKFNIYTNPVAYDIRYSTSEITSENFDSATQLNATISGNREITATFNLDASLDKCYYVAVRPYSGTNLGTVKCVRVGGNKLIPIDYEQANVYHGEILSSFANLFDEQSDEFRTGSTMPSTVIARNFTDTESKYYNLRLAPIVDLETLHYISSVYLYYADEGYNVTVRWSDTPLDFMSENSAWDGYYTFTTATGWNEIEIGTDTRYIQVVFTDGTAPYEMLTYGYQNGEGDKINTSKNNLPSINEMMGMCGFTAIGGGNTPVDSVICTSVLREYHNFGWAYVESDFPGKASYFSSSGMGNFDQRYAEYVKAGINLIPCIQWDLQKNGVSNKIDEDGVPVRDTEGKLVKGDYWDKFDPNTYYTYADLMFAYSARYGTNTSTALLDAVREHYNDSPTVGLGLVKWLELGNEPDASWHGGIDGYFSAYQLAALTSAGYDGHCSTINTAVSTGAYHFGAKNANTDMGVGMAGISAASNEYITAMCYWMKANRADGKVAIDAFNVHQYMSKAITVAGDKIRYVGMSPEEADLPGILSQLVEIRDKYYKDKEVWLTEFGWDTNQSYATVNSAHAYGEYTGRQVQAMWLTRAYLLLSASGVDKATMYMCEDTGVENEAVGKFGSSGVIGYEYDEDGNVVEFKKDSYYYLYTLKNTLGDYIFTRRIETYDENVMLYEYQNEDGKTAYAVWCPTSDGTKVEGYCVRINSTGATLVENVNGLTEGKKTELEADELGYVKVNVSENPIYIVVD